MNKTIKSIMSFIISGTMLAGLVYGQENNITQLQNVIIFLVWIMSLSGLFGISKKVAKDIYEKDNNWKPTYPKWVGILLTVTWIVTLSSYGYFFLAVIYILSSLTLSILKDNIVKLQNKQ